MNGWAKTFLLLGSLAFSAAAAADLPSPGPVPTQAEADAVVKAVEAKYAGVQSLKARFVQTTRSQLFDDEQQAGTMVVKRPSKMRWDFEGKQFITDGRTMWIYTVADKQAIRIDDVGSQADAAQELLTSLDKLDELFEVEPRAKNGAKHVFVLKPKKAGQVKNIELTLTPELVVDHLVITDAYDGVTELAFSQVELGAAAPDSLFDFTPPAGVEVIAGGGL